MSETDAAIDTPTPDGPTLFWQLVGELQAEDGRVHEGRIMSSRCARVDGEFLAMCARQEWGLVVKLPRQRVDELVASGEGRPFSPNGRVFREWVCVPDVDGERWAALLREGVAFVG